MEVLLQSQRPQALVTGASSGIGLELAREFALRGYDLILVARREDRLKQLATQWESEFKIQCHVIVQDLSIAGAATELASKVSQHFLKVDVLVNNAGFGLFGDLLDHSVERIEEMLRLNVLTLTSLTRIFSEKMKMNGGGQILQIASVAAFQPTPHFAAYAASKAYVLSFGQALSEELKDYGVSVTTVCPGMTESEFFNTANFFPHDAVRKHAMTSSEVAKESIAALLAGHSKVTPGLTNRLQGILIRFVPQILAAKIAAWVMKKTRTQVL